MNCLNFSRNLWCKAKILAFLKCLSLKVYFFSPFIFRTSQFWLFVTNLHEKFISGLQQVKQTLSLNSTYLIYSWHQVSYFVFHQTILSFWTKFAQKENFQSKTEKVNITTKFSIFALVSDAKFHLKQIILFFCTKFAQKGYFPFKAGQMNFTTKFRMLVLV